jgi:D-glycero-alpha-D-manno-heptose-7-phosphate kinase
MIVTQTPLRVSLAGGGTDLEAYWAERDGFAVSMAIDKFAFVIVRERFDDEIALNYTRKEIVSKVDSIEHDLVREAMRMTGVERGVEVTLLSDVPAEGSGLGSSSSFAVGLLNALYAHRGEAVAAERLAREACAIEVERLGKPTGKQDQYVAAYGGLCGLRFRGDGRVDVKRIPIPAEALRALESQLHLFYTGRTRNAHAILREWTRHVPDRRDVLDAIRALALVLRDELVRGDLHGLGPRLHASWELKRQLAPGISDPSIDAMYELARAHGALGGRLCGAGGGGFLLVCCPPDRQERLAKGMQDYRRLPFRLERDGSKVIFNYRREIRR